jgi:hypothetical protein
MAGAVTLAQAALTALGGRREIGVYANALPPQAKNHEPASPLDELRHDLGAGAYLALARTWVERGATIIGGRCGIGPRHIAAPRQGRRATGQTSPKREVRRGDDKLAIEMVNSPHFRGYTRIGGEIIRGRPDWREQLDVGAERAPIVQGAGVPAWTRLREPSQWPASQPGLRPVLLRWQAEATTLLLRVLRAMAPALGQPGDVFRPIYAGDPHQLLKMIRYPGRDATEGGDQGVGADCRWSTTVAGSTRCRCPVRSW